jgi:predicted GIY-YIG superfamily endonuclease
MDPISVSAFVYVLELQDGYYYVGVTYNLNQRWAQHQMGQGANWTKLHRPVRIVEVITDGCSRAKEDEVTQRYMDIYGRDRVRGGSWCRA